LKNRIESRDFKGEGPTFILGQAPRGGSGLPKKKKAEEKKAEEKAEEKK